MSKHTPGPWTAYDNAAYGTAIMAGSATGQYVASVQKYVGLSLETYQANARLIAAAPDMLEALKLYDAVMTEAWGEFDALPDEYSARRRCWTAIRAAIAQAEGRAS